MEDKPYLNLDLVHRPVAELVPLALAALRERDAAKMEQADQILHYHFLEHLKARRSGGQKEFLAALLEVADSREVRQLAGEGPEKRAARWEHLFQILEAVTVPESLEAGARRFLESLAYGEELLRIVAEAEEAGEPLTVSGLAERLGRSDSTVVQVLGKMEAKGLIERQRDGRNTFVGVGLMGQAMVAPRKPELVRVLPPDSRVLAEVSSPKGWLCA